MDTVALEDGGGGYAGSGAGERLNAELKSVAGIGAGELTPVGGGTGGGTGDGAVKPVQSSPAKRSGDFIGFVLRFDGIAVA